MESVKQRMLDICNSVPDNFFEGLKPSEMVFKLMFEYIDRYGKDETTKLPGTNEYLTRETIEEIIKEKNMQLVGGHLDGVYQRNFK